MKRFVPLLLLWFAAAPVLAAAPNGARLFEQHCAACHGAHGHGGVGVPLALPDFLAVASNHYLFTTIRLGRPGRVMPAHPNLSDAQINAIIHYIRSWAPPGQKVPPRGGPVAGNVAHGKALFAAHCARCHGADGGGGHGTGVTFSRPRNLPIMPPALNNVGFLAAASDTMIKHTLERGRKGTPMVSFLKQGLSEQDIDDVVAYVRSFQKHPLRWHPDKDAKPVMEADSPYSLKQTVKNVKQAVKGQNFILIRVQYLEQGLFPADKVNKKQVIIYFCNFPFVDKELRVDPRIGLFMPCRVTVVQDKSGVKVYAMNPKFMSRLYNNEELDSACTKMHDVYENILEDATL